MFKRKIYNELENWKGSLAKKKKAILIKGLRQIGKTTVVKEFAYNNYDNVIYLNFLESPFLKNIFKDDLTADSIIRKMSVYFPESSFEAGSTVIIYDEVQECNNARYSIKPLMVDGRFDVIATGSLLGLRGYNHSSGRKIPTGSEHIVYMYPMDFEEYLWAKGISEDIIDSIKESFKGLKPVDSFINDVMHKYFVEYLMIGGMPEVVESYLADSIYKNAYDIQKNILEEYKDDFGKYLDKNEEAKVDPVLLTKIMDVYNSIPMQLAKKNKKFTYNEISSNASSRKYLSSIVWLEEFGLIRRCYNLNLLELPLEGNKNAEAFKIYVADTGLFMAMLGPKAAIELMNNSFKIYKGAIYENIVADALIKNGKPLYYFSKSSGLKIDFITEFNFDLTAIEVKSNDGRAKSLKEILTNKDKYDVTYNFKLNKGNVIDGDPIKTIPLYMAYLIR